MSKTLILVWLRRDLRLTDNPALSAAIRDGAAVLPVYVLEDSGPFAPGAAAQWWLHHSLDALGSEIRSLGGALILRRGDPERVIIDLVSETRAKAVYWNRRYDDHGVATDKELKSKLVAAGCDVQSFAANLLIEPWRLKTGGGGFYKVFTPFWKALQREGPDRSTPEPRPDRIQSPSSRPDAVSLQGLGLLPVRPNWAKGFEDLWTPGEAGAHVALDAFIANAVADYAENRNRPDLEGTSRLSPHLAFGEISPLTVWRRVRAAAEASNLPVRDVSVFLSEVAWRDFAYNLLYHYDRIDEQPIRAEFAAFEWRSDEEQLEAWRRGRTGVPIVDAGMRQLWRTGWMHNRVRMIVASYLIKNLLIDWRQGERWFWDTLLDADPANNPASWQWVAGCGADAAPYFRIFNPLSQGERFDPNGDYVRQFVPELRNLPTKYIHAPASAPESMLAKAGVAIGKTYPAPLVDLAATRKRALERYERLKTG